MVRSDKGKKRKSYVRNGSGLKCHYEKKALVLKKVVTYDYFDCDFGFLLTGMGLFFSWVMLFANSITTMFASNLDVEAMTFFNWFSLIIVSIIVIGWVVTGIMVLLTRKVKFKEV